MRFAGRPGRLPGRWMTSLAGPPPGEEPGKVPSPCRDPVTPFEEYVKGRTEQPVDDRRRPTMTQQTITADRVTAAPTPAPCDRATSVTRSLLGYGVIAGPVYVLVSLAQALTRDGFRLDRHAWSLLANGDLGWIQITNLVLAGVMTAAFAAGLRRALRPGRGSTWVPRLVAAYGVSLVGAGVFRADPALGFPVGTPDGVAAQPSWHGLLHFASGGVGFACLIAACLVLGRRFAADGRRDWAVFSRATGVAFLAGFVGIASGGGRPALNVAFLVAVLLVWAWMSAVAVHFYRRRP